MRNRSVCIFCGEFKNTPFARCLKCGKTINADFKLKAKCYMLSEQYFIERSPENSAMEKLKEASAEIKSGKVIDFCSSEIDRLVKEQFLLEDIPRFQTIKIILFCAVFFIIPLIALLVFFLK